MPNLRIPRGIENMTAQNLITKNGLQVLRESLGLAPDTLIAENKFHDVLFVAIDFERIGNIKYSQGQVDNNSTEALDTEDEEIMDDEDLDSEELYDEALDMEDEYTPDSEPRDSEVGIAILDTRDLSSSQPEDVISTYNLVTGSDEWYTSRAEKFLFGLPVKIHYRDMLSKLNSLIPRTRNIVLVGHDIETELRTLGWMDFDFQTSIVGILDTQMIFAQDHLKRYPEPLWYILQELGCPFNFLHCGGNDAHFTLTALLLLAIRDHNESMVKESAKLSKIQEIAKLPLPPVHPDQEWKAWDQKNLEIAWKAGQRASHVARQNFRRIWHPIMLEIRRQEAEQNSKLAALEREATELRRDDVQAERAAERLFKVDVWDDIDLFSEGEFFKEDASIM